MLLFDIMRNFIFLPLNFVMDYELIDEDKELNEEKEFHHYKLQIAI